MPSRPKAQQGHGGKWRRFASLRSARTHHFVGRSTARPLQERRTKGCSDETGQTVLHFFKDHLKGHSSGLELASFCVLLSYKLRRRSSWPCNKAPGNWVT